VHYHVIIIIIITNNYHQLYHPQTAIINCLTFATPFDHSLAFVVSPTCH